MARHCAKMRLVQSEYVANMFHRRGRHDKRLEKYLMPNPERILRLKTVLARTGLSRSTVYRKIADGTFPAQVRISVHGAGWHESAINEWIADPVAYGRDMQPPGKDHQARA